ncbi:MAG: O-antigen ligase family protein [Firmicutes bacterium]|nr:O-antigen ligase family protein [Bacillota bacterium]MCL5992577.1 O-antigen ligase family protein [Bacillota bacterium]
MGKKSREKQQPKLAVQVNDGRKVRLVQDIMEQPVLFQGFALFAFIALCVLLFYPPYMRAMFFTREQLPTHLLTYAIFMLWWAVKYQRREFTFLREPLDYIIFAFVLAYVLSFTVAINSRGAIQEFLKVSNYFLVYWLVAQLGQVRKGAGLLLLNVLLLSALGVAVLGLGAAAGTWEVVGGYVSGRIYSTIQYPNSLAAYLTGAFLVCLGLWQTASWKLRQFYAVAAFLLLITAILTYSRGGWAIIPVFSLLYVVLMPRTKRLDAALFIGLVSALAIGLTPLAGRAALAGQGDRLWLLVFAGCLVTLVGQYLLIDLRRRVSPKLLLAVSGLLLLLFSGILGGYVYRTVAAPLRLAQTGVEQLVAVKPGVQYNLAMDLLATQAGEAPFAWQLTVLEQRRDNSIASLVEEAGGQSAGWERKQFGFTTSAEARKILVHLQSVHPGTSVEARDVALAGDGRQQSLSFAWNRLLPGLLYSRIFGLDRERNVAERFVFFRDAWEIIKDHPWRGLGGHAWSSIYFKYQSADYSTTEVHNHFLQVWIETGIIGFLLFLAIWLGLIFTTYRLYKQAPIEQKVLVAAIVSGVLAVVTHSLYDFNLSLGAIGIFLFGLMGVTRSFVAGTVAVSPAKESYKPVLAFAVIIGLAVFVTRLLIGHAAFEEGNRQMNLNLLQQAVVSFERAERHDPFNTHINFALAEVYEIRGAQTQNTVYFVKAKEQYRAGYENNRYNPFAAHTFGSFLIRAGLFEQGLDILRRAIELQPSSAAHYRHYATAYLRAAYSLLTGNDSATGRNYLQRVFAVDEKVQEVFADPTLIALSLGQAHFMLGDYEQAKPYLEKALYSSFDKAHAKMMLALLSEKEGDSARHQELYEQAIALDPTSETTYQAFKTF